MPRKRENAGIKVLVGIQNHFTSAALWAPFSEPKKTASSASLAALRDSDFNHQLPLVATQTPLYP